MPSQPARPDALTIEINRAPVLTLWAAVVAERLGFHHNEALTLGKALAGLNAQSKGRRLGIFHPVEAAPAQKPHRKAGERHQVDLLGRAVPVEQTSDGVRAVVKDQLVTPESVERYLQGKFGDNLEVVREAMTKLANRFPSEELTSDAFLLYEQFRPAIPAGVKGWGATGKLDLGFIASLAK